MWNIIKKSGIPKKIVVNVNFEFYFLKKGYKKINSYKQIFLKKSGLFGNSDF